jgi:HEPN domain-containing protein
MDNKTNLVKNWLIKAYHDLNVAKKLVDDEEYHDVAIYHCQQVAEKALKGLLTLHDLEFPKTHDIRLLVQMAVRVKPELRTIEDSADLLTPYATEFRYPGEVMNPSFDEFHEALLRAEDVFNLIVSLLPEELKKSLG